MVQHIVAWAHAWAPWLPQAEAERIAEQVAAAPRKWSADALAWRLNLSMVDRTALNITTIGAYDVGKAERMELRKLKRREAERKRRAAKATRPRGRPRKIRGQQVDTIAGHGISANGQAARETSMAGSDQAGILESRAPLLPSTYPRAALPAVTIPSTPPPEVVSEAINIAYDVAVKHVRHVIGERETRCLLDHYWPRYAVDQLAIIQRYYGGRVEPRGWLRQWQFGFKALLEGEYAARERHRARRASWSLRAAA